MNNVIIGSTNEHLYLSVQKKIPIVLTYFQYLPFESYSSTDYPDKSLDGNDLAILKKPNSFSQCELREKLLFLAEMNGLIISSDVYNILLDYDKNQLTIYNKKNQKKFYNYKQLYILDPHKITFSEETKICGSETYEVIDLYKNEKSARLYIKLDDPDLKEIYYFDNLFAIISKIETDSIDDWSCSPVSIRYKMENILSTKFKVKTPLPIDFYERVTRPKWRVEMNKKSLLIKYELN